MAQFSSQFEAVVIESALARTFNGNCRRVSHGSAIIPRAQQSTHDFASDDPCARAPGAGEEENVNADERNECLLTDLVRCANASTDASYDELARCHADGAEE